MPKRFIRLSPAEEYVLIDLETKKDRSLITLKETIRLATTLSFKLEVF